MISSWPRTTRPTRRQKRRSTRRPNPKPPRRVEEGRGEGRCEGARASDGKVDLKFDDVKSGQVAVEATDGAPAGRGREVRHAQRRPWIRARGPRRRDAAVVAVGAPPEMPAGTVEDPMYMPTRRTSRTAARPIRRYRPVTFRPGTRGSFRRGDEFALVYRQGTCVISRTGAVGTRGQWRVVEYPTSASASNSYAKECSRFVSEGFSDYRE
jgi:hypothetical protein